MYEHRAKLSAGLVRPLTAAFSAVVFSISQEYQAAGMTTPLCDQLVNGLGDAIRERGISACAETVGRGLKLSGLHRELADY